MDDLELFVKSLSNQISNTNDWPTLLSSESVTYDKRDCTYQVCLEGLEVVFVFSNKKRLIGAFNYKQ